MQQVYMADKDTTLKSSFKIKRILHEDVEFDAINNAFPLTPPPESTLNKPENMLKQEAMIDKHGLGLAIQKSQEGSLDSPPNFGQSENSTFKGSRRNNDSPTHWKEKFIELKHSKMEPDPRSLLTPCLPS